MKNSELYCSILADYVHRLECINPEFQDQINSKLMDLKEIILRDNHLARCLDDSQIFLKITKELLDFIWCADDTDDDEEVVREYVKCLTTAKNYHSFFNVYNNLLEEK